MGKLNPEKISQRLQEMNRYLDFIPTGKSTGKQKKQILALGKEPWKFKDLNNQLASYRQQWKYDQQNQIRIKMAGKMTGKSGDSKRKNNERNNHNSGGGRSGGCQGNNGCGGRGGRDNDKNKHLKMPYATIVIKRVTIRLIVTRPRKMEMKNLTWFRKRILKIYFNLI
jgi:hypothetical protein